MKFLNTFFLLFFSLAAHASEDLHKDIQSIESMAGCYRVDFSFFETLALDPDHKLKDPYLTAGYEYITIVESFSLETHSKENRTIVLQHILDFGEYGQQKHWRQDWTFGPTERLNYQGVAIQDGAVLHRWNKDINEENTWTQSTYGVGDEPRQTCSADWSHGKYSSNWKCQAWSPLPRRDYKKGFYYQVLDRNNHVLVSKAGWRHVQENTKIILDKDQQKPIAKEVGVNSYIKVDDAFCQTAKTWWGQQKSNWSEIRSVWDQTFQSVEVGQTLSIFDQIADKHLYEHLMEAAAQENTSDLAIEHIETFLR